MVVAINALGFSSHTKIFPQTTGLMEERWRILRSFDLCTYILAFNNSNAMSEIVTFGSNFPPSCNLKLQVLYFVYYYPELCAWRYTFRLWQGNSAIAILLCSTEDSRFSLIISVVWTGKSPLFELKEYDDDAPVWCVVKIGLATKFSLSPRCSTIPLQCITHLVASGKYLWNVVIASEVEVFNF